MQLSITNANIWISVRSTDFRKSIDGLCALIQSELARNPMQGVYLFFNKAKDKVKVVGWHRNGFILLYKRLERGKFTIAPKDETQSVVAIDAKQLGWILAGLDWLSMSNWDEFAFENFS